jgi:predicted hotdog family 3-hydroxylacyl-ACP dehydratase
MRTIEDYLAHRGPARWVDRLIEADADQALVECDVPAEGRMVRDGAMPAWAGVELMAQAVAVWAGARARSEERPVRLGFLLGTRAYDCRCDGFASGSTLRVSARRELVSDEGLGMFDCRIHRGDELLAQARVAVFEPNDPTQFLDGTDERGQGASDD